MLHCSSMRKVPLPRNIFQFVHPQKHGVSVVSFVELEDVADVVCRKLFTACIIYVLFVKI